MRRYVELMMCVMRRYAGLMMCVWMCFGLTAAETKTWTGSISSDWFDDDNWTLNGQPVAGDSVIYTSAGTPLVLTNATPLLGSFTMQDGTLTFTNWTTRIWATDTTIDSGIITLPGPFTDADMSNRVWFVCPGTFTLGTNATINVNGKGFHGGVLGQSTGSGPGGGTGTGGGAYGGEGGSGGIGAQPYGSPEIALQPGSGGGYVKSAGGHGGGAVLVESSGTVTLYGDITANGTAGTTDEGGGSGGAIRIDCERLNGSDSALLSADGGAGQDVANGSGGGRIAVVYHDPTQGNPRVRFETKGGVRGGRGSVVGDGQSGTLYLPDTTFLSEFMADQQFTAVRLFMDVSSWAVDSLTTDGSGITFASSDFTLVVSNNLYVKNGGLFGIGDFDATNVTLDCRGDLVVENSGELYVYAGVTNGTGRDYGMLVTVAGRIVLTDTSWIHPESHPEDGGSVRFETVDVAVDSGSGFDADASGWASQRGPGKGLQLGNSSGGAGHGGAGGTGSAGGAGGSVYGVTNAPVAPGSGGGYINAGGWGGGLIWVRASGDVRMDGTATADGQMGGGGYVGGGSGGSIWIESKTFTGSGVLSARGGDSGGTRGGAGGGGRIAVWYGGFDDARRDSILGGDIRSLLISNEYAAFNGEVSATNGVPGDVLGGVEPGTVVFLYNVPTRGTVILVR